MDKLLSEALTRLPHGPQFRFVDRLLSLVAGQQGTAEYRIRGDEPFLAGHFPGQPLFPGVLLVEAAAQLAGVVAQSDPHTPPLPGLKLTALKGVKFLGTAQPGEVLQLAAQVTGRLANLVQADAVVRVDGRKIMEGALTLSGETGGIENSRPPLG